MFNIVKWFTEQTKNSKVEIILIVICVVLVYHIQRTDVELKRARANERRTDSIHRVRYNRAFDAYKEEINNCKEGRMQDRIELGRFYQEKYYSLYKESDQIYQNLK